MKTSARTSFALSLILSATLFICLALTTNVAVFTTASSQTIDKRPVNPQLIDTLNSHLAACDKLLAPTDSFTAPAVDLLTGFEFDPFVFVASERSTSRLLLTTNAPNIRKITVSLSDLGSYFGTGTVELLDSGISPDAVAGDGIFTGNVTILNTPANAFGGGLIRNIALTVQRTDLTTITITEDVAASYGYISTRDSVPVTKVSEDLYVSRHSANLIRPDLLTSYPRVQINAEVATPAFLQRFADVFDWVVFFNDYNQRGSAAGTYLSVKNGIQGIGLPLYDYTRAYGSQGKLRGIIGLYFKSANPMSHEIFHTWGAYGFKSLGLNLNDCCHWDPLARADQTSVFGFPPTLDGFTILDGGRYQGCIGIGPTPLSLELYLMGLLPSTAVGSYSFLSNATWHGFADRSSCPQRGGYIYNGSGIATMSLTDIVAAFGPRVPPYPDQNSFRAAVITVSRRALHPEEWDYISRIFIQHQETFRSDFQGHASVSYELPPAGLLPTITGLSPNSARKGDMAFTLTVNGTGFLNVSTVRWNGSNRPTTFVSAMQLTAAITAADIATATTAKVTVSNPPPLGVGNSNELSFTVNNPAPAITGLSRNTAIAGSGALALTVNGTNFILGSQVRWNGADRPTTFVSNGTQLNAQFSAADLATAGIASVTVFNPAPGGGVSNALSFTITQPSYEADVSPRPNGNNNGAVTITDWVQIGRFVAGLDTAANGSEFQRADCAPRDTLGDGRFSVSDWVQAGRFAARIDPVVMAGGPTMPTAGAQLASSGKLKVEGIKPDATNGKQRAIRAVPGIESGTITIELNALGDENAIGWSLHFDSSRWRFVAAITGNDARLATLHINARQAASGRIGLAMALPTGQMLPADAKQVVVVSFAPIGARHANGVMVEFADYPVAREVVDVEANVLPTSFVAPAQVLLRERKRKRKDSGVKYRVRRIR